MKITAETAAAVILDWQRMHEQNVETSRIRRDRYPIEPAIPLVVAVALAEAYCQLAGCPRTAVVAEKSKDKP